MRRLDVFVIVVLFCLIVFCSFAHSQEVSDLKVELSQAQKTALADIGKDFTLAQTQFELAKARVENTQLKYLLAINQIKTELKLSDEYLYDEKLQAFIFDKKKGEPE